MGKRKKPKKIIIKANSISKKKKVSECCRCNKVKKYEETTDMYSRFYGKYRYTSYARSAMQGGGLE